MSKHRLTPPPKEIYSLHRKIVGTYMMCIKLKSKIRARDIFLETHENWAKAQKINIWVIIIQYLLLKVKKSISFTSLILLYLTTLNTISIKSRPLSIISHKSSLLMDILIWLLLLDTILETISWSIFPLLHHSVCYYIKLTVASLRY